MVVDKRKARDKNLFQSFCFFPTGQKRTTRRSLVGRKQRRDSIDLEICRSYVSQVEVSINKAITFQIIEIGTRMLLK
jgi:hypothetical protein